MDGPIPQPIQCDGCRKIHNVIADHCAIGEHCIATDAACNASWAVDDHSHKCCVCKEFDAIKPRG